LTPSSGGAGRAKGIARLRLLAVAAAVTASFLLVVVWLGRDQAGVRDAVDGAGGWAPAVFVALTAGLTCALFPFPVAAAASGVLFGVTEGALYAIAGGWAGAMAAFGIARRFGAAPLAELAGERLTRLLAAVSARGFSAVLLLRVVPGVPRDLANYLCGLTSIRAIPYGAATAIGISPRAYAYAALGGSLGDLGSPQSIVAVSLLVAMGALGLGLLARERGRSGGSR
jgi:uncharacterized membrane protein YdjX (TVP38/TMEM64 family)